MERALTTVGELWKVLQEVTNTKFEGDLLDTPDRWWKMMKELTIPEPFNFTTFETSHQEMVIVKKIPFYSLCAHHLIPFFGTADVGYIPQGQLVGLSKIARTVQYYMRSLQVQEELTAQIADRLEKELKPRGTAVVLRGVHLCMRMRGVESDGETVTSAMRGVFLDNDNIARREFLALTS